MLFRRFSHPGGSGGVPGRTRRQRPLFPRGCFPVNGRNGTVAETPQRKHAYERQIVLNSDEHKGPRTRFQDAGAVFPTFTPCRPDAEASMPQTAGSIRGTVFRLPECGGSFVGEDRDDLSVFVILELGELHVSAVVDAVGEFAVVVEEIPLAVVLQNGMMGRPAEHGF